jgi:hypothetical protein
MRLNVYAGRGEAVQDGDTNLEPSGLTVGAAFQIMVGSNQIVSAPRRLSASSSAGQFLVL